MLRDVIQSVDVIMKRRAEEAGLVFEVSMDEDFAPTYIGNRTAIQQILINFLNNAAKYTNSGGAISLKVFEADSDASVASLCFVISDTGIGISKEFIPEMFKPFTREKSGDRNEASSMGLGLSIAYNLIQSMDGNVSVESEVGTGSTFTILIKLKKYTGKRDKTKRTSTDAVQVNDLTGCNVLVAEDNPLNRMILGAILKKEGITFAEAEDGEMAVKTFVENPANTFDCILMDMRMPNIDGIKATMMIRDSKKKDAATIPIIGVSANGFSDDIKQAKSAGLDAYTTKPIDKEKLLAEMMELIHKKE